MSRLSSLALFAGLAAVLTAGQLPAAEPPAGTLPAEKPEESEEYGGIEFLQALADVRYHRLDSAAAEHTYHVYVRLPHGYSEGEESLPVVYLLDGGVTFPLLAGYQRYLELSEEVPAAILVGISYGNDDWQTGNNRGHDFTAPSAEREHYGGAADFQRMLREELIPWVEERFRADPRRRVIFGQSLGGQFVLYSALTQPRLFWGHIASNPALHRNLEFFLRPAAASEAERSRVFVSSGSNDNPRFREPALAWIAHWESAATLPWSLSTTTLEGQNHFSAAPEAYKRGMAFVFAQPSD